MTSTKRPHLLLGAPPNNHRLGEFLSPAEEAILLVPIAYMVVLLVACSACAGRPEEQGPVVRDLLDDVPCVAPCWQGIMPGQTAEQEAVHILLNDTASSPFAEAYTSNLEGGEMVIRWVTRNARLPSTISPLSELRIQQGIAHHMYLALDTGLTAQMVVDKWGEPNKTFVYSEGIDPPHTWARLCYPEKGIELIVYLGPPNGTLALESDNRVLKALFYSPMTVEQWLNEPLDENPWRVRPPESNKILDWPGFGPIPGEIVKHY